MIINIAIGKPVSIFIIRILPCLLENCHSIKIKHDTLTCSIKTDPTFFISPLNSRPQTYPHILSAFPAITLQPLNLCVKAKCYITVILMCRFCKNTTIGATIRGCLNLILIHCIQKPSRRIF